MRTNRVLFCYKMQIQYLLTIMCILRMSQRIKCERQRVAKGEGIHIMVMKNVYHIIPLKIWSSIKDALQTTGEQPETHLRGNLISIV